MSLWFESYHCAEDGLEEFYCSWMSWIAITVHSRLGGLKSRHSFLISLSWKFQNERHWQMWGLPRTLWFSDCCFSLNHMQSTYEDFVCSYEPNVPGRCLQTPVLQDLGFCTCVWGNHIYARSSIDPEPWLSELPGDLCFQAKVATDHMVNLLSCLIICDYVETK